MDPQNVSPSAQTERRGYLLMLKRFIGSKSERLFPCLIGDEASLLWIKHRDDDSFRHASLRGFHGQHVQVTGALNSKGDMIVDHISSLDNTSTED